MREVPSPSSSQSRSATAGSAASLDAWKAPEDLFVDETPPEEIVVTGSRMPERTQLAMLITDVIDARCIKESGARDAGEALEHQGMLQLQRSFRGTELWLRGLDPE